MADELPQAAEVVAKVDVEEAKGETQVDEASENKKGVDELLSEGNAALALGKYAEASEHFSFAVEKLVEKHGEMSIEIVDALQAYGEALLRNGIASSNVLGGEAATGKVPEADQEKAAKEGSSTEGSASATSTSIPAPAPSASSSKPAISKETQAIQNHNFHFGGDAAEDEEDEDDEEGEGEGNNAEEPDDFETAWEILDTARAILVKSEETEADETTKKNRKLQLARIHSSMAEIATESGRPAEGVKEYETALSIQSSLLPAWDRLVAQTHLFIALALELVPSIEADQTEPARQETAEKSFGQAVEHVQAAQGILTLRKKHLLGYTDEASDAKGKGKATDDSADLKPQKELSEKEKDELKDIDELFGDLNEKIDDLKAQIVEAQQKPGTLQEQLKESASALPEGVSREVHNLNSMVKKKKKPAASYGASEETKAETNGVKRKAEDSAEQVEANGEREDKRTKVE